MGNSPCERSELCVAKGAKRVKHILIIRKNGTI